MGLGIAGDLPVIWFLAGCSIVILGVVYVGFAFSLLPGSWWWVGS